MSASQDCAVEDVIAHRGLADRLPQDGGLRVIALDARDVAPAIARRPKRALHRRAAPVDTAFVLFSTATAAGRPTGIVHEHAGVADMVRGLEAEREARTTAADPHSNGPAGAGKAPLAMLLASRLADRKAILELWAPLAGGGRVEILDTARGDSPAAALAAALRAGLGNAAVLTAEEANEALGSGALAAAAATLRRLWVVEPLAEAQLASLAGALPHTELVMGYGRAETMPYVAAAHAPSDGSLGAHAIGRPLLNMRVREVVSLVRLWQCCMSRRCCSACQDLRTLKP